MPNLLDEIRTLAQQLATTEDEDVRDSADILCQQYRHRRLIAFGLSAVKSMVQDGPEIDENDPHLVTVHEWFRDSLQELARWAMQSGRMR
jgi:hypothetical protein